MIGSEVAESIPLGVHPAGPWDLLFTDDDRSRQTLLRGDDVPRRSRRWDVSSRSRAVRGQRGDGVRETEGECEENEAPEGVARRSMGAAGRPRDLSQAWMAREESDQDKEGSV